LVRVLIRGLQRDARSRFATAADFGRALSDLLPDPITAREDTARFFRQVHALYEIERGKAVAPRPAADAQRSASSLAVPDGARSHVDRASVLMNVAAGVLVLVSVAVLGWALAQATDVQTSDQGGAVRIDDGLVDVVVAGTSTRPVPVGSVEPVSPAAGGDPSVDRVVVRGTSVVTADGRVEAEVPAMGFLDVSAVQRASIYVGGELWRAAPGQSLAFPPGDYDVRFVAEDGRSSSLRVSIQEGKTTKKVYDFDKLGWR
jgi:hypothetical protein